MSPRIFDPGAWAAACLLGLATLAANSAHAQVAAPGDVYYQVHVDQRFKYYAFPQDEVTWANLDWVGTSLAASSTRDTTMSSGLAGLSVSCEADAGLFTASFLSHIDESARVGVFHYLTNAITVSVYVRGPAGTPYWIDWRGTGVVEAARIGGLPGSLAPLNGVSEASFLGVKARIDSTGSVAMPVDVGAFVSGVTTTEILVGVDTYSFARSFVFSATPTDIQQAVCILGCMAEAATFHAAVDGSVVLNVYPYATPVGIPATLDRREAFELTTSPNPFGSATTISFRAPAGEHARVELFDVRGRRVTSIFDGVATGETQRLAWRGPGVPEGVYFLRVQSGNRVSTLKIARLR